MGDKIQRTEAEGMMHQVDSAQGQSNAGSDVVHFQHSLVLPVLQLRTARQDQIYLIWGRKVWPHLKRIWIGKLWLPDFSVRQHFLDTCHYSSVGLHLDDFSPSALCVCVSCVYVYPVCMYTLCVYPVCVYPVYIPCVYVHPVCVCTLCVCTPCVYVYPACILHVQATCSPFPLLLPGCIHSLCFPAPLEGGCGHVTGVCPMECEEVPWATSRYGHKLPPVTCAIFSISLCSSASWMQRTWGRTPRWKKPASPPNTVHWNIRSGCIREKTNPCGHKPLRVGGCLFQQPALSWLIQVQRAPRDSFQYSRKWLGRPIETGFPWKWEGSIGISR